MLHRYRRARTMLVGLLTSLAWAWSVVRFSGTAGTDRRELARNAVYTAAVVAANVQTLRSLHGDTRHDGGPHVFDGGIAAPTADTWPVPRDARSTATNRPAAVARYRVSPHDATAPPSSVIVV